MCTGKAFRRLYTTWEIMMGTGTHRVQTDPFEKKMSVDKQSNRWAIMDQTIEAATDWHTFVFIGCFFNFPLYHIKRKTNSLTLKLKGCYLWVTPCMSTNNFNLIQFNKPCCSFKCSCLSPLPTKLTMNFEIHYR